MHDRALNIIVMDNEHEAARDLISALDTSDFAIHHHENGMPPAADLRLMVEPSAAELNGLDAHIPTVILTETDESAYAESISQARIVDVVPLDDLTPGALTRIIRYAARLQRAEAHLAQSENLSRLIIANSSEGIIICDHALCCVRWNATMEALTGLREIDVMGERIPDILPGTDENPTDQMLIDALAGRMGQTGIVSYSVPQTGRSGWYQSTFVPHRDDRGDIIAAVALIIDVTESRRLLNAYHDAAEEYRTIFRNVSDGIYRSTPDGQQLRANPALVRLNGFESEEQMLKAVEDIAGEWYVDPTRREEFKRILNEEGAVVDFQSEIYRYSTRERIWISESAYAVRDDEGNILYYDGTIRDITTYKRNEAELIRINSNLRKAQEIAHLGSWEWDLHTQEMNWSEEMYRIYGLDPAAHQDQVTVDTFINRIHDDDVSRMLETLLNGLDSGRIEPIEFRVVQPNGEERTVLGEEEGIYDAQGKLVSLIGAVQDITERKKAEADRERLLANLNRLTTQLSAAASVSKSVITILDTQALIEQTVNVIKQSYDLYYVGMFLVDEAGEYAVLKAGTGEEGQQMLAVGHKLLIGGHSMIGQCVKTATARIATDVAQAVEHYDNPYLPDTRSELALPLIRRGLCFGALTVQESVQHAFLDSDVTVLQTMVDQVAGAIENARLFEAAQHEILERKQAEARAANLAGGAATQSGCAHHPEHDCRYPVSIARLSGGYGSRIGCARSIHTHQSHCDFRCQ